ncbi:CLUMA_CG007200, isoform A [Clunio marinus]|uniref:CLUMA_CG007200, isoform A n=1 Tax=Clunio marinus TaxID=568069 RepID=A0A1J1HZZ2_9DIPT|nr:CLUMA_CG007200, isoform A [Clunio marinus]
MSFILLFTTTSDEMIAYTLVEKLTPNTLCYHHKLSWAIILLYCEPYHLCTSGFKTCLLLISYLIIDFKAFSLLRLYRSSTIIMGTNSV